MMFDVCGGKTYFLFEFNLFTIISFDRSTLMHSNVLKRSSAALYLKIIMKL